MTCEIHIGDCRDTLARLPEKHFQACVTSPPYFALRDYGTGVWVGGDSLCDHKAPARGGTSRSGLANYNNGLTQEAIEAKLRTPDRYLHKCRRCGAVRVDQQLGLESTPEEYLHNMVHVFRGVHRCLRDDGTLWLNMGDSYSGSGGMGAGGNRIRIGRTNLQRNIRPSSTYRGIKRKDMLCMPWRLAMALQQDGCPDYKAVDVLQRVIDELVDAYKGEPLPDRVLGTLERLEREWFEAKGASWVLRQDIIWSKPNPMPESTKDRCTKSHEYVFLLSKARFYRFNAKAIAEPASENTHARISNGVGFGYGYDSPERVAARGRTRWPAGWESGTSRGHRSLTGRYDGTGRKAKESGRAAQGLRLSESLGRGPGWRNRQNESFLRAVSAQVLAMRNKRSVWEIPTQPFPEAHFATFPPALAEICVLGSGALESRFPVLDNFGGAGTVGLVCERLGVDSVLCELGPQYGEMSARRIRGEAPLLSDVRIFSDTSPEKAGTSIGVNAPEETTS